MTSPFTASPKDTAIEMLTNIFGPAFAKAAGIDSAAGDAASGMLSEAFRYFNSGVMFFGALILMYVSIFGVINTANDGEALGKKWSTFYTPLRTFGAAALLIPGASGYSAIQLIMFSVVASSIGFASNLWQSAANYMLVDELDNNVINSVIDDRNFELVAANAIRMQVCARAIEQSVNAMSTVSPVKMQLMQSDVTNEVTGGTEYATTISYQDPNWGGSKTLCGAMRFVSRYTAPTSNSKTVNDTGRALQEALNNVRLKATLALFSSTGIQPISNSIIAAVETDSTVKASDIQKAIAAARVQLTDSLRQEVRAQTQKTQQPTIDKLTEKGWMWAGSLHTELSRVKDAVRMATKSNNDFQPGSFSLDAVSSGEVLAAQTQILAPYQHVLSLALNNALRDAQGGSSKTPTMPAFDSGFSQSDFVTGGSSIKSAVTRFFKSFGDGMVSGVVFYLDKDDKDVLWQVKDLGDYISGYTEAGMVASAVAIGAFDGIQNAAMAASNQPIIGAPAGIVAGVTAGIKSLFTELLSMIKPAAYALLYAGYFLGIWLPAVPFIVTALAAVGWVITCLETFIAGALWTAAHVTPAREESFIGSQTQGYLLVLSTYFKPALIVFGLIASMAILNPLVHFINQAFILFFRVTQADSMVGLLSAAGFILLYCIVIFSVFMMVFTLPQLLPDRILKWIGAGTGDVGETGSSQRVEHGASSQARAAMMAGISKSRNSDNGTRNTGAGVRRANNGASASTGSNNDAAPEGLTGHSSIR